MMWQMLPSMMPSY